MATPTIVVPGVAAGDTVWTNLSLTNSWVAFGAPYATPGYRKDALGFVHLRGIVKNGSSNASIATLPVGYRIGVQGLFAVPAHPASYYDFHTDGTIVQGGGSSTDYLSLDGITYLAEG